MIEVVGYHTFIFGLNQAYCLQKNKTVYIGALSYLARFWLFSKEEIRTFGEHIKNYTQGIKVVKSHYHIGLAYMRSGQIEQGIDKMLLVIKNHPQMDRVS